MRTLSDFCQEDLSEGNLERILEKRVYVGVLYYIHRKGPAPGTRGQLVGYVRSDYNPEQIGISRGYSLGGLGPIPPGSLEPEEESLLLPMDSGCECEYDFVMRSVNMVVIRVRKLPDGTTKYAVEDFSGSRKQSEKQVLRTIDEICRTAEQGEKEWPLVEGAGEF